MNGAEIKPFGINLGIDKIDDHILVGAIYVDGSEFAIKSRINKKDVPNPDFNFDSFILDNQAGINTIDMRELIK